MTPETHQARHRHEPESDPQRASAWGAYLDVVTEHLAHIPRHRAVS